MEKQEQQQRPRRRGAVKPLASSSHVDHKSRTKESREGWHRPSAQDSRAAASSENTYPVQHGTLSSGFRYPLFRRSGTRVLQNMPPEHLAIENTDPG